MMSAKQIKLLWPLMIALALIATGLFWAKAGTETPARAHIASAPLPQDTSTQQVSSRTPRSDLQSRLARQPEVSRLRRSIGQRLTGHNRAMSMMIGRLTTGTDERSVRILRRQDGGGESVEIAIGNNGTPLTWSAAEGAKSSGNNLADTEQAIIERLTFDSPDQFVLAQLRGASYYTVGHNVRPAEAGGSDNYTGPTWDIIRVSEPARDAQSTPQSRWRLYYINSTTNLVDRIVSEMQGETVTAELSGWTTVQGEKVPSQITWSRQGQVVMQFSLTNFSHSNQ